jgi:hypothetical protein
MFDRISRNSSWNEISQAKFVEKIKTHILCSVTFIFSKIVPFLDNVEKYCTVVQATDEIMAHARCMVDT